MFAAKDWKLIQTQRRLERQTESLQNRGPLFSFKQSEEFETSGLGKISGNQYIFMNFCYYEITSFLSHESQENLQPMFNVQLLRALNIYLSVSKLKINRSANKYHQMQGNIFEG